MFAFLSQTDFIQRDLQLQQFFFFLQISGLPSRKTGHKEHWGPVYPRKELFHEDKSVWWRKRCPES